MNPAATWGVVVSVCVTIGFAFGFAACYFWMREQIHDLKWKLKIQEMSGSIDFGGRVCVGDPPPTDPSLFPTPQRAETPVQRETQPVRELTKEVVPSGSAFGKLKYEDVGPMFLDNFLLKYFHDAIKPVSGEYLDFAANTTSPWTKFCQLNPWAKGMPEVFWMMTGYRPDEYQLNQAVAEYSRRAGTKLAPGIWSH